MKEVKFLGLDVHNPSISAAVLYGNGRLVMQLVLMTEAPNQCRLTFNRP